MSVIFFEGFETYGPMVYDPETGLVSRKDIWGNSANRFSSECVMEPRNNGLAFSPTSGTSSGTPYVYYSNSFPETKKVIMGIAVKSGPFAYYGSEDGPTAISMTGKLTSTGNSGTPINAKLWNTPNTPGTFKLHVTIQGNDYYIEGLAHEIWHYFEAEIDGSTTGSYVKFWVNGSLQLDVPLDTSSYEYLIYRVGFSGSYGSDATQTNRIYYDDMYVLDCLDDSDGAKFQDRLGPIEIRPIPLTSDGTVSNWETSGSGDAKFEEVNEGPGESDLDASYIVATEAPRIQTFRGTAHDSDLPIIALTSFASVKQPDPTNGVANIAFVAGTQQDTNSSLLQDSYRTLSQTYTTLSGGLDVPNIEATNFGVKSIAGT